MDIVYQNNPGLPEKVRLFGCKFRSLLALVEYETEKNFTIDQIIQLYDRARKYPGGNVMSDDCYCLTDEHLITRFGFELFGLNRMFRQVGTLQNNVPLGWDGLVVDYDLIIKDNKTKTGKHFTAHNKDGSLLLDPWDARIGGDINIVESGAKVQLYRLF